jgi:acetyltransferase-like isoleucine patch superfamily enzyme
MSGGSICVAETVTIGNRVALGANSTIADTDFHPLAADLRRQSPQRAKTAPVFIEDDVFIGMNSIILKGVTIGRGSVVGAGSVVSKDVPPQVIVAGNPARIVREIH